MGGVGWFRLDYRVGALPLLAMTTGGGTYDARASLAWLGPAPPWAKARFAPPLPVAASVIPPTLLPAPLRSTHQWILIQTVGWVLYYS